MDPSILSEMKHLEANSNKVDSGVVYDLLIHSIKGKYFCEEKRKKFVIFRTMPNEKIYQPNYAEQNAKEFLDCYSNMLKVTKASCQNEYKKVYECLSTNHGKNYDFPVKCVDSMERFINC